MILVAAGRLAVVVVIVSVALATWYSEERPVWGVAALAWAASIAMAGLARVRRRVPVGTSFVAAAAMGGYGWAAIALA